MAGTPLSADPKLIRVSAGPHPDTVTPGVWVNSCVRGMAGFTPVDLCTLREAEDEFLPADFFSELVAGDVFAALDDIGYAPAVEVVFPPLPVDLEVWDPETNEPYP